MPRTKGVLNRASRCVQSKDMSTEHVQKKEEIEQIDSEVLDAMSRTNRMRLTHADVDSLTLRQKQAAGAEYLAAMVGHPEYRKRLAQAALQDPMTLLKIASSERPKEIHLEAEIQHNVVVVPTQLSAEDWEDKIKTIENGKVQDAEWEGQ